MKILVAISCSVILLGLLGCSDMKGRDIGTIAGAGTGAAIGSAVVGGGTGTKVAGAAVGAVGGGVAGHYIGKSMEKK